jgi:hypothetical protein
MVMNRLPWCHAKAVEMGACDSCVVAVPVVVAADAAVELCGTKNTVGTTNIKTKHSKKQFGDEMLTKLHDTAGNSQTRQSDTRERLFRSCCSEGVFSSSPFVPLLLLPSLLLQRLLLGIHNHHMVMCDHSSAHSTWTH